MSNSCSEYFFQTFEFVFHLIEYQLHYLFDRFWCGMYNHFDKGMQPKQSILDHLLTITQKKAEGEKKMTDLQRVSGYRFF